MSEKKKGNLLRLKRVSSVDLCPQGANPDADICLFKSVDGQQKTDPPLTVTTDDANRSFFKSLIDALTSAFSSPSQPLPAAVIEKDAQTFSAVTARQEMDDNLWKYMRAFEQSVNSIVNDGDVEAAQKDTLLNETLEQFGAKMKSLFPALIGVTTTKADDDNPGQIDKSTKEGDDTMDFNFDNIDKSALSAEELATFEALAKKSMKKPEETPPATEPATPPATEPATKSAEKAPSLEDFPEFKKMFDELSATKKAYDDMIANQAKNEMLDVAKKYVPLGKKPEELAETLQALKKSGDAAYNAFIEALDGQLDAVNKSGVFTEFGKNTHGDVDVNEAFDKTETLAKARAAEKGISIEKARCEIWDENPDLADACASN